MNRLNTNQLTMTKKNYALLASLFCALIFTVFFHRQELGLNVFLMELVFLIVLTISKNIDWKSKNIRIFSLGLLLTSLAIIFVFSPYVITINLICFFIFIGILLYPKAKSLVTTVSLSFTNILASQSTFFTSMVNFGKSGGENSRKRSRVSIYLIPVIIILFFMIIYSGSSPYFSKLLGNIGVFLQDHIFSVFKNLDLLIIFTFIIGLLLCNFVFFRVSSNEIIDDDTKSSDEIIRFRKNKLSVGKFKFNGLKEEFCASIFLLLALNFILMIVNALDIYWVWFNFSWNGLYLKQFVHEGTYLLLLSIICSIIIVLYFFRGNLNFYSKNRLLKQLSMVWLVQNAILTISVGIRNFHYIHYFALAYKRVGLMLFLLLTLYGLFTVYIKVLNQKSSFYLFRTNFFAIYIVLVGSSLINWENWIANYNFKNYKQSFVELRYLSSFPDKSLPNLDKSLEELKAIKKKQKELFPSENEDIKEELYFKILSERKQQFIKRYESLGNLSWNYPEYIAYQKLKNTQTK